MDFGVWSGESRPEPFELLEMAACGRDKQAPCCHDDSPDVGMKGPGGDQRLLVTSGGNYTLPLDADCGKIFALTG
jgi:hypothetical protein